jgi:D-sedoheptulose 7-phosphate isomerase
MTKSMPAKFNELDSMFKKRLELVELLGQSNENKLLISHICSAITDAFRAKKKLIFAGNGGSFADAQHLAAEFVGRFKKERGPLSAMTLGTNSSLTTAIGNDYKFNDIFARELSCLGERGDIFIALSTSGNSENVLSAIQVSHERGITTFGFTGQDGGMLAKTVECIKIPSIETEIIQEGHIIMGHILCELVEREV